MAMRTNALTWTTEPEPMWKPYSSCPYNACLPLMVTLLLRVLGPPPSSKYEFSVFGCLYKVRSKASALQPAFHAPISSPKGDSLILIAPPFWCAATSIFPLCILQKGSLTLTLPPTERCHCQWHYLLPLKIAAPGKEKGLGIHSLDHMI